MVENKIKTVQTDYLKPSETIETIFISNMDNEKIVYLYNFEGNHFRLFFNIIDLISFFNNKVVDFKEFANENDLDNFLIKFEIE